MVHRVNHDNGLGRTVGGARREIHSLIHVRSRDPQWDIGIRKAKGYWITTLERTLVDCLLYRRLVGHQVALAALKQALSQRKVKLGRLYDVANTMGVAHRIRPVIEVLGT